ncbi:MAG: excinuclease ABC subunit UvrA [Pirellulaceae bacterium]
MDRLRVTGARTHNLRNVSLEIPHNKLTVITGVSGSGKSSLAFDTLYAEGQRQYIESLSTYARQFLNQLERPEVDSIEGLQPTLCIDQRAGLANPRSTVATVTEVYDYLRLLMARAGTPHCFACNQQILQQSPAAIVSALNALPAGTKLVLMAPVVRGRKGAHRDALTMIQKAGLVRVRVDNELWDIESVPELAVRKNHTIEAVVDKIVIRPENQDRLAESLQVALKLADGLAAVSYLTPESAAADAANIWQEQLFSTRYACPDCGVSYEELEPRTFSFNSPYGACNQCDGLGEQLAFDPDLLVRDWSLAGKTGAFALLASAPKKLKAKLSKQVQQRLEGAGGSWDAPLEQLSAPASKKFFQGSLARPGLLGMLNDMVAEADEDTLAWLDSFRQAQPCSACGGARLRKEALAVTLDGKSIAEITSLSIRDALPWFESLSASVDAVLDLDQRTIARPILAEMLHRLQFLVKVGVGYLSLGRGADTLSGGELQRVRLATSIGSGLVGVCYILDEPSIGLHQRDNDRLIESLRELQQRGNTVIVVEHDEAMMLAADVLIDMGPGAGQHGGTIVAEGTPAQVQLHPTSITAAYLRGERRVTDKQHRRTRSKSQQIKLTGATLHNLQNVSVEIPLGLLVGITGVSGSGTSSLIGETLVPALARDLGQAHSRVGPFNRLTGVKHLDKLIEITQAPIGRTPRSTPATYCGVFDLIRSVWANTRESKTRGFTSSRFSFNAGGGRCEECKGQGQEKIEMNFLPDMYVTCSACSGLRFNRQTLQVRYRDKSIADVLEMCVDEASEFFENFSKISRLLRSLQQVGLGYLALGQSSSTLSGGEAQRIKLATELARAETGRTIYFLDEPTTGLHFEDVKRLVEVLDGLVERGNTVIIIEHNVDVIAACDWLIDLGPDGGDAGGQIVACGTPEQIAACADSLTGRYLHQ